MGTIELILTSISLSIDAFAVSICKGLSNNKFNIKNSLIIGTYFGLFQGIMPLIGYLIGTTFTDIIISIDHYIAFILLGIIGINMVKEGLSKNIEIINDKIDFKTMIALAIATSIDALAVGITFAFLKVNVITTIILITIITFIMSILGYKLGNKVGSKYQKKSQIIGGIILIIIGTKILLEHLNIIK